MLASATASCSSVRSVTLVWKGAKPVLRTIADFSGLPEVNGRRVMRLWPALGRPDSDGRDTSAPGFPALQNRSFTVKITRLLRF